MERLQKVIAQAGIASRRKAEEMIKEGRVEVNGEVIVEMGYKVKKGDFITVDGDPIEKEDKVYFLMNKPKKTICSNNDEHGRTQVSDLIPCEQRIFTVGRLDYDTSGLILLTNDGEFANTLVHPRYHIPKTYNLTINGVLSVDEIKQIDSGIILDDGIGKRQVVSGIAGYYTPADLIGKKVCVVANLKPAKLCGVESNGMILASDCGDSVRVIFLDSDIPNGSKIR